MTVYRYYLPELPDRREDSWSVVLVDQEMGILAIVSDWGNFTYAWGPRGRVHADIRQELLRFGDNYIQDKLADHQNMKFDAEQTIQITQSDTQNRLEAAPGLSHHYGSLGGLPVHFLGFSGSNPGLFRGAAPLWRESERRVFAHVLDHEVSASAAPPGLAVEVALVVVLRGAPSPAVRC